MPQNTQPGALGTQVGYQNPGTTNLTLDAEVVGTDPVVTTAQLTREFVIPVESISGHSPSSQLVELLGQLVSEIKRIRFLMEAEAVPGLADEIDEATPVADEPDSDESQGS
jgi:hypothetical protein